MSRPQGIENMPAFKRKISDHIQKKLYYNYDIVMLIMYIFNACIYKYEL